MQLNSENYYTKEANLKYLSVSTFKNFFGTLHHKGCEAQAMAILNGDYKREPNTAMLIGSYVDAYVEGTLDKFKERTPQLFKKDGSLKAEYIQADTIIARMERDKHFMFYLSGDKQTIMTAELFGIEWKIKIDSYLKDKAIVDLKVVSDIYEKYYTRHFGNLNFIQAWGYDFQLAIYQAVVEANTGKKLPCYIAAADKGKTTNIELIQITQQELDGALAGIEWGVNRIKALLSGEEEPERCGKCDYCKETKVIKKPITMADLLREE